MHFFAKKAIFRAFLGKKRENFGRLEAEVDAEAEAPVNGER